MLLSLHLEHVDKLNAKLRRLEEEIDKLLRPFDHDDLLARLQTIPGVGRKVAQVIMAEIGPEVKRFSTAAHLASWVGLAPGKNESAGRNHSSRTPKANRYLRQALVEAAPAAGRERDHYLSARYHRLSARRGR